ncbi:hypothetical protein E2C01_053211 [Portunus trituberculatus]|uniref:Uncharacterized protein n=1 Tax=Portunus trituberculatus TaxID=210409 RepID=A0A5B7GNW3_PORTR|nr:hypothetical protein [Portunus trituberculatus]
MTLHRAIAVIVAQPSVTSVHSPSHRRPPPSCRPSRAPKKRARMAAISSRPNGLDEAWVRRLAGGGGRGWCEAGVAAGLLVVASASLFCEREDQAALSGTRNTFRLPLILCTMTRRKHRALQGCVRTRSPQYSYRRGEKNT